MQNDDTLLAKGPSLAVILTSSFISSSCSFCSLLFPLPLLASSFQQRLAYFQSVHPSVPIMTIGATPLIPPSNCRSKVVRP